MDDSIACCQVGFIKVELHDVNDRYPTSRNYVLALAWTELIFLAACMLMFLVFDKKDSHNTLMF